MNAITSLKKTPHILVECTPLWRVTLPCTIQYYDFYCVTNCTEQWYRYQAGKGKKLKDSTQTSRVMGSLNCYVWVKATISYGLLGFTTLKLKLSCYCGQGRVPRAASEGLCLILIVSGLISGLGVSTSWVHLQQRELEKQEIVSRWQANYCNLADSKKKYFTIE